MTQESNIREWIENARDLGNNARRRCWGEDELKQLRIDCADHLLSACNAFEQVLDDGPGPELLSDIDEALTYCNDPICLMCGHEHHQGDCRTSIYAGGWLVDLCRCTYDTPYERTPR